MASEGEQSESSTGLPDEGLGRGLKGRQIQMIAIGGAIGVGLPEPAVTPSD